MTRLQPPIANIERSYRAWLEPDADPVAEDVPAGENPELSDRADPPPTPPHWVADQIRRHVSARPEAREPAVGDLVVVSPETGADHADDSLPLVMLLDGQRGNRWSGWLVGEHPDYAGSQDLVLESALLADGRDPAPIAAFVQTWNRVHRHINAVAEVVHRLTPEAMAAVRELSLAGIEHGVTPTPGRMRLRRVAGMSVITGTPYGRHDPRDEYLLLSRELAAMVSEPLLERDDPEYGDDKPDI